MVSFSNITLLLLKTCYSPRTPLMASQINPARRYAH